MNEEIGDVLVSYNDLPFSIKYPKISKPIKISQEEFNSLKQRLKHIKYNNIYTQELFLQITARCNFNCQHCFSCKDNFNLLDQMPLEKVVELLDMAKDCGIYEATITGGEPTVHPQLKDIIRAFKDRNIVVTQFVTNGYLLSQDILDLFKEIDMNPIIKISFDGLGVHDTFRGINDAQEATLKAIELSVKNGFYTYVHTQVNKKTIDSIPETLRVLDEIGVNATKLIKTISTPRWELNSNDSDFTAKEYYELCLKLINDYSKEKHNMSIVAWGLTSFDPNNKMKKYDFPIGQVKLHGDQDDDKPICSQFKDAIYVGANGNVYPCLQMQGILEARKLSLGNVFKDGLHNILQDNSDLSKFKNHTIREKLNHNKKCCDCAYSKLCTTGCPAISWLFRNDVLGLNNLTCEFYESGIYKEVLKLSGYGIKNKD